MNFEENLSLLRDHYREMNALRGVQALLNWDQLVMMPSGSAEGRSQQMALIGGLAYDQTTSPELGLLIEDLATQIPDLDVDDPIAREIKVARRNFELATKIPKAKMLEFITTTSLAQDIWLHAKEQNDFASFLPHLEHIVALLQEYTEYFKPYDHPYDTLLMQYEPGIKTAEIQAIFDQLRPRQVALIQSIVKSAPPDDSFRFKPYDLASQRKLGQYVATLQGYDWQHGRLDETMHPFTTTFGQHDVRITTHYYTHDLTSALFSTMHETGHALYEQGVDHALAGTSLELLTSTALHESQSRLWENLVGRSKEFCEFIFPTLQAFFPENLAALNADEFYRGVNKVTPSLIRIEADEATYNLHIMLRMEIEIGLIEGKVAPKELPELWNAKMQDYLGVSPATDSEGVLQDVHWSGGSLGYFPCYALGNLISAQLWAKMLTVCPNIPNEIRAGRFGSILGWLRENVHAFGGRYDAQELTLRATGEKINPEYYLTYLSNKYGEIYHF